MLNKTPKSAAFTAADLRQRPDVSCVNVKLFDVNLMKMRNIQELDRLIEILKQCQGWCTFAGDGPNKMTT